MRKMGRNVVIWSEMLCRVLVYEFWNFVFLIYDLYDNDKFAFRRVGNKMRYRGGDLFAAHLFEFFCKLSKAAELADGGILIV